MCGGGEGGGGGGGGRRERNSYVSFKKLRHLYSVVIQNILQNHCKMDTPHPQEFSRDFIHLFLRKPVRE